MERYLARMVELLDIQQQNCVNMGAKIDKFSFAAFKGGDKEQNSYYSGHLNMAQAIAWESGKDIVKRNGKHILIDEK